MDTTAIDLIVFAVLLVGIVVIPDSYRFVSEFKKTVRDSKDTKNTVEINKDMLVRLLERG